MNKGRMIRSMLASAVMFAAAIGPKAQNSTCQTATAIQTGQHFAGAMSGGEAWYSFVATGNKMSVRLEGPEFSQNLAHAHRMQLYSGSCGNLQAIGQKGLGKAPGQNRLQMDMDLGNLVPGQSYFLQVLQENGAAHCPKANCQQPGNVPLSIQIDKVEVLLPPDAEPPVSWHVYEENRGQLQNIYGSPANDIDFYTTGSNPVACASKNAISWVWIKADTSGLDSLQRVDLRVLGGNPSNVLRTGQVEGYSHYYLGHAPDGVEFNKAFDRVIYEDILPGIDLQLYSDAMGFKAYFVCDPNVDAASIEFELLGQSGVLQRQDGGLSITTQLGDMQLAKAEVFRINPAGNKVPMPPAGAFEQRGTGWGFAMMPTPDNMPTVVVLRQVPSPPVASTTSAVPEWGTFYKGPADRDSNADLDTDEDGNLYATGETYSFNFPLQFQTVPVAYQGSSDAFISKFSSNYERRFTVLIGAGGWERPQSVDVDPHNNRVHICGNTAVNNAGWPASSILGAGSFVQNYPPMTLGTGFIASFDRQTGSRLWATLFGATGGYCTAARADDQGNLYVVGGTFEQNLISTNMPSMGVAYPLFATGQAYLQTQANSASNAFIAKFNPQAGLEWSSIFGGDRQDVFFDLAIDDFYQKIYAVGASQSNPLGATSYTGPCNYMPLLNLGGYYQSDMDGGMPTNVGDGLITRFSFDGRLEWSTFYGGSGYDIISGVSANQQGFGINANPDGSIYIVGRTNTPVYDQNCSMPSLGGFPLCANSGRYLQPGYGGGATDAFVARLQFNGQLVWSTYLGGGGDDCTRESLSVPGPKVKVYPSGYLFVAGSSTSGSGGTFPLATQSIAQLYSQPAHADLASAQERSDGYLMGFSDGNQLYYSSYVGGRGEDYNHALAIYSDKVFVGGTTRSSIAYPLQNPVALPGNAWFQGYPVQGGSDVHYAQLQLGAFVGIEDKMESFDGLAIFPNPANAEVKLSCPREGLIQIRLIDQLGRELLEMENVDEAELTLPLEGLSAGIYFVNCGYADGKVLSSKLLKL